jgi:hypothetical protein
LFGKRKLNEWPYTRLVPLAHSLDVVVALKKNQRKQGL